MRTFPTGSRSISIAPSPVAAQPTRSNRVPENGCLADERQEEGSGELKTCAALDEHRLYDLDRRHIIDRECPLQRAGASLESTTSCWSNRRSHMRKQPHSAGASD